MERLDRLYRWFGVPSYSTNPQPVSINFVPQKHADYFLDTSLSPETNSLLYWKQSSMRPTSSKMPLSSPFTVLEHPGCGRGLSILSSRTGVTGLHTKEKWRGKDIQVLRTTRLPQYLRRVPSRALSPFGSFILKILEEFT